jgi:hypothetical protein
VRSQRHTFADDLLCAVPALILGCACDSLFPRHVRGVTMIEEGAVELGTLAARSVAIVHDLDASGDRKPTTLLLPHGSTFDGALGQLRPLVSAPLVTVDALSLLRFSQCGFNSPILAHAFDRDVVQHVFKGQYSFCGVERNPQANIDAILAEAQARHVPADSLLNRRRNW